MCTSLRAFVERFGKTTLSIDNLSPEVALHQMINGLRSGPFADSLCKRPTASMAELRQRAAKYMRMEELKDFKNKVATEDSAIEGRANKEGARKAPARPPTHPRAQRFAKYTPLNALRSRVLEEALDTDLLSTPRRANKPPNADTTRQCRYHGNFGHSTEECTALQDKIEELIQAGHLQRFVVRENENRPGEARRYEARRKETTNRREPNLRDNHRTSERRESREERGDRQQGHRPPLRGTINTISEGFAGGGSTTTARKKHLRVVQSVNAVSAPVRRNMPPITFTSDDVKAIDTKQDDPMVITVDIENFAVKKVLVDQGSSVDILYWETFKKLQIPEQQMSPFVDEIVGFSGERVQTRGYVDLYTTFGEGQLTKTISIRYLVLDANTSYNMLLGRPSLNALGAIVSTPHLAMKFPSLAGDIVTIYVDQ